LKTIPLSKAYHIFKPALWGQVAGLLLANYLPVACPFSGNANLCQFLLWTDYPSVSGKILTRFR
jgi:hypothetical protein